MPKLVADEVEVSLTPHPVSDEPDHLVECQATANDVVSWPQPFTTIFVIYIYGSYKNGSATVLRGHSRVHLLVHEPESDGLVPYQGLVM